MTPRGKPNNIIRGDSDRDVENKLLEYNIEFLSSLEKAKEEYVKLGGVSIDDDLRKKELKIPIFVRQG